MKKLIIPFLLLFLVACDSSSIEDEKLTKLYVDLVVAREKFIASDSLYYLEKEKILNDFDVTDDEYKLALKNVKFDDKRWSEFFKNAMAYVDSLEKWDKAEKK